MMNLCEFGDDLVCKHCGFRSKFAQVKRKCTTPRPLVVKLTSYAQSLARWIAAGAPLRQQVEIDAILRGKCEPCDRFRDGVCDACGCRVNSSPRGWLNKIAMATESCPLTPPRWSANGPSGRQPLRVALVTPVMMPGGVESWHISLSREVNRRDDVRVSCVAYLGGGGNWNDDIAAELSQHAPILSVHASEHARKLSTSWEILQVAAESSDAIVVWSLPSPELQFLREQWPSKLIVGVSHGETDWWMSDAARYVDRWVAVSEAARSPIPAADATVINNGVDVERCRPTLSREAVRDAAGIPRDARLIVSIGRLSPEKRLHLLAGTLDRLPPDCWLWLVGDGREVERCRKAAGPSVDRLVISPARRDVGNVLGAADCFAFVSQSEGYGLAPVEALAAGVPLVATPVGILPQISPVAAEWLPLNPAPCQISDAILETMWTPPQRIALLQSRVSSRHSAEAMASRWAAFLTAILAVR